MVPLLPPGTSRPSELRTADAWLRPQRREDAAADLEAVLASREKLRVWCDGDWPEDGFGLAANAADLAGHIADAESGIAFGFTVWDPTGTRVLGSVYLDAVAPFLDAYRATTAHLDALAGCDVRVEAWLRADVAPHVERRILGQVRHWLDDAWPFRRPCWGSRRGMAAHREHLEALGLVEIAVLVANEGPRRFHFHAAPAR